VTDNRNEAKKSKKKSKKKVEMADSKGLRFSNPPILNIFFCENFRDWSFGKWDKFLPRALMWLNLYGCQAAQREGGFHLHLLVFPFIYQFNTRIVALVCSSFANEGFQHHFSIILRLVCCGFYMKMNVAFTLISFAVLK
jgi:hypothetical protein